MVVPDIDLSFHRGGHDFGPAVLIDVIGRDRGEDPFPGHRNLAVIVSPGRMNRNPVGQNREPEKRLTCDPRAHVHMSVTRPDQDVQNPVAVNVCEFGGTLSRMPPSGMGSNFSDESV